ncbi:GGDEF domain-containing protein [uncultured Pseudoalteromonas sp.]|uniref:GGDEF domain-containing protein n=1 Tax=uncultured Pseudoalteromonas sp. TaxID=114053 RepID=UPI000C660C8E|nr:GGDEF domain-containing protein [uncultured Pseudoalteromonas sp.]MBD57813.1 GGDEF domain-containing protein [Pseudoalteromonas sp.]|tara:strand:- start:12223 stop:13266 length:1044 start_codon:yes stop_codon:yes gene_type:complete
MDIGALRGTQALRNNVLKWMGFCLGVLASIFAVFNLLVTNMILLGALEVIFALFCFYIFFYTRNHNGHRWQSVTLCIFLTVLITLGTYLSNIKSVLFIWTCSLPILFYLLLGKQVGLYLSLIAAVTQAAILSAKPSLEPLNTINFLLNFSFTYISIWAVSHTFENSRAEYGQRLENLALLDPLTGAGNRLAMTHYFEIEQTNKHGLFILMLDLDYFKKINDHYGHEMGDRVLIEVTRFFRQRITKGYVFRIGGEEFAIFLPNSDPQGALDFAQELREQLASTIHNIDEQAINLTVSIGVACYTPNQTLKSFIKRADDALYQAKQQGRNRVVTAYELNQQLTRCNKAS